VNSVTIKDGYSLETVDDLLGSIQGSKWFSNMNLAGAHWQVSMALQDRAQTAICTHSGLFEWRVKPYGLCNSASTCARLLDLILGPIRYSKCLIHLDDVVALGGTWKDQISNLAAVFDRLRSAGLKLKPSKCQFFRQKVPYLGYVISEKGIGPDPSKVEAITKWQPPMDVKGVKAFLVTAGCYRSFIKDYADKAAPLNQLLRGGVKFEWTADHQRAFDILKNALISEPILSYTTR
jgi:hypothetical protein